MTVVLATHNPGKRDEIQEILAPMGWKLKTLSEMGISDAPEETGDTFLKNARIKAQAAVDATGHPALADDSGLCVSVLDSAPGVFSARFGGFNSDRERNTHLLRLMEKETDRRCSFICCLVLCYPDGREISAEGRLDGELLYTPRGENGFGYDPLFFLPERKCSVAELSRSEKSALSHRGRALRELMALLQPRNA